MSAGMSGTVSVVAFEAELNSIVKEYLECAGLERTLSSFDEECQGKGKPIASSSGRPKGNSKMLAIQNEMIQLFQYGNGDNFFSMWEEHLSDKIRNTDPVAQKLEFYLYIYFAIYPMQHAAQTIGDEARTQSDRGMAQFKHFLETRGSALSQTTEFLPFYALPFVPNPRVHPSFKDLFADTWVPELQQRLEQFLTLSLQPNSQPRLFELYQGGGTESEEKLRLVSQRLADAERRTQTYVKRYNKMQADYHNLIGITAELVETFEQTLQGKELSMEYLSEICSRLFSNQVRQSLDLTRPGTAALALRQSIAPPQPAPLPEKHFILDYTKIKNDLLNSSEKRQALLLQALRWRLTKSAPGEQRDNVLHSYISDDLLGCSEAGPHRRGMLNLLTSPNEIVRQYSARLVNAFASLCEGRTYLATNPDLLRGLMDNLRAEDKDSITRENVLGALQKLSLRRNLQSAMIDEGILKWLVSVLEDNDSLSDYTLEYSVALLMNLCLRTQGKRKCSENAHQVLKVLSDLLGHENQEIRPYVNGALYSILGIPSIREEAKAMGMEEMLRCCMKEGNTEMNRQFEFIIRQLNSAEVPDDGAQSDDEDEEEEEEEDQDAMEADLDKAEVLKSGPGELSGEQLLKQEYMKEAISPKRKNKQLDTVIKGEPLHRPVTPSQHKQQVVQPNVGPPVGAVTPRAVDPNQRPPTRSGSRGGSRPPTGEMSKPQLKIDPNASDYISKTLGQNKQLAAAQSSPRVKPSSKALNTQGENANFEEYTAAFSSRPRITRTADGRPSSRSNPQPKYSESLPRSRPGTQSSRPSTQSRSAAGSRSMGNITSPGGNTARTKLSS